MHHCTCVVPLWRGVREQLADDLVRGPYARPGYDTISSWRTLHLFGHFVDPVSLPIRPLQALGSCGIHGTREGIHWRDSEVIRAISFPNQLTARIQSGCAVFTYKVPSMRLGQQGRHAVGLRSAFLKAQALVPRPND
jgi:hypothetical protein